MIRPDSPTGVTEFPDFDLQPPTTLDTSPIPAAVHTLYDMPLGYSPTDPLPLEENSDGGSFLDADDLFDSAL